MRLPSGHPSVSPARPLGRGLIAAAVGTAVLALTVHAAETLPGPVPADILAVIDGDTVTVRARIWLGQDVVTNVRIDGIDAPESNRPGCAAEREQAAAARATLDEALASRRVTLTNVRYDKWGGRVLADLQTDGGESVKEIMLKSGHAHAYDGGQRRNWCDESRADR